MCGYERGEIAMTNNVPMIQTNWFAIDGAPYSGRSSLASILSKETGWRVCQDSIQDIHECKTQKDVFEKFDHYSLIRTQHMNSFSTSEILLCDGGLPGDIARMQNRHWTLPQDIISSCNMYRYKRVFILDVLPLSPENECKDERYSNTLRTSMHRRLWDAYQSLGYTPIRVPTFQGYSEHAAISQRMQFIWDEIESAAQAQKRSNYRSLETA